MEPYEQAINQISDALEGWDFSVNIENETLQVYSFNELSDSIVEMYNKLKTINNILEEYRRLY